MVRATHELNGCVIPTDRCSLLHLHHYSGTILSAELDPRSDNLIFYEAASNEASA